MEYSSVIFCDDVAVNIVTETVDLSSYYKHWYHFAEAFTFVLPYSQTSISG